MGTPLCPGPFGFVGMCITHYALLGNPTLSPYSPPQAIMRGGPCVESQLYDLFFSLGYECK